MRSLQVEEEDTGGEEKVQRDKIQKVRDLIAGESAIMLDDDPELVLREMEVLRSLKTMVQTEDQEEEELLQTKIISAQEVKKNWEEWKPSIDDEVNSLLKEKEALRQLSQEEYEKLIQDAKESGKQIQFIPSKVVFTKKPSPLTKTGKCKTRWVVCGNFEERREGEQNYSGGADAAALRIAIATAAHFQGEGSSTDVRTAFLNADMDYQEGDTTILIKAPSVFVEKGYMKPHIYFIPLKAVYGFRRSPRLWGKCRDDTLKEIRIEWQTPTGVKILYLEQLQSEANLWKILEESADQTSSPPLWGLLMSYVDDILVVSHPEVLPLVMQQVRSQWKTMETRTSL